MKEMLDCVGVPEFYSDKLGALEGAGNGMVRAVRCIERNGVLIPVFSCVMPAYGVLKDGPRFREMCLRVINDMRGELAH
jgi:hypothetical protein